MLQKKKNYDIKSIVSIWVDEFLRSVLGRLNINAYVGIQSSLDLMLWLL